MAFALAASVFAVISIHALREESDLSFFGALAPYKKFQSTLSVRRATGLVAVKRPSRRYFNPRSP